MSMTDYNGPICYLWSAEQTEPGCDRVTYEITEDANPPERIKPLEAIREGSGLIDQETLWTDWKLIGIVKGEAGDGGVIMRTKDMWGEAVYAAEIVSKGWYTSAKKVTGKEVFDRKARELRQRDETAD